MKKFLTLALLLVLSLTLVGCAKDPLKNDDFKYYVILNGNGLNTEANQMEAVSYIDKRVRSIKKTVKSSQTLYLLEVEVTKGDTLQVARVAKDAEAGTFDFKAQDKLSGPVKNLTENNLTIPEYTEFDNGNGTWADAPTVEVTGTVYIVFSETSSNVKYLGVLTK